MSGGTMDQHDPEQLGAFVGAIVAAGAAVIASIRSVKAKLSTGAKVDKLTEQVSTRLTLLESKVNSKFTSLEERLNTYFIEDARLKSELSTKLSEAERRVGRLEDRL